jgi:signal transduction histidine kinase
MLEDHATWRDLQWLVVDSLAGAFLGWLAFGLFAEGLWGIALAAGAWQGVHKLGGADWYGFIHITGQSTAWMAAGLGVVWLALGLRFAPGIMVLHTRLTRTYLSPTPEQELRLRVSRLAETRTAAADASAAELRRIERDLHDGAQARLVAMGMSLGMVEHLMETDPAKARQLLAEARQSSAHALTELRELVQGIHPPVLAERGLGDAVRALALRSPIPADVTVELPGRFEAPVEAAAYFAVSELLTNAAKHSGAQRIWLDVHCADDLLRVAVGDDGRGGADPSRGTGLAGVERRLATFDGVLAVSSPPGGPTTVTMELPCALSSPKTSSS